MKKLSEEWSQIQIATSISGVMYDEFAPTSNALLFPKKIEGDFDGLTAHLIEAHEVSDTEVRSLDVFDLDCVARHTELPEDIKKAAENLHDVITQLARGKGADISRLLLHGSHYTSGDENWHTDGYPGKRRVGIRVSGPETEVANVQDVYKINVNDRGDSDVSENPRIVTYGLCTVWANKPGVETFFEGLFGTRKNTIDAVTHRKGHENGQAGMIFTTNLDF